MQGLALSRDPRSGAGSRGGGRPLRKITILACMNDLVAQPPHSFGPPCVGCFTLG